MKIVLVGNPGVGKSSYLRYFCPKSFDQKYAMSIGFDFCLTKAVIRNHSIKFQIWYLFPNTKFNNVRSVYYYGALGAIVMFDVTNPSSFSTCESWIKAILKHNGKGGIPIILAGNKTDIRDSAVSSDSANYVSDNQALAFIDKLGKRTVESGFSIHYFPLSVKTGFNISEVLELLGSTYLDYIKSCSVE